MQIIGKFLVLIPLFVFVISANAQSQITVEKITAVHESYKKKLNASASYTWTDYWSPANHTQTKDAIAAVLGEREMTQFADPKLKPSDNPVGVRNLSPSGTPFYSLYSDVRFDPNVGLVPARSGQVRATNMAHGGFVMLHPFDIGYRMEGVWISDVLKRGTWHIQREERDPRFGTLLVVSGEGKQKVRDVHPVTATFWFAKEHGLLCTKVEWVDHSGLAPSVSRFADHLTELGEKDGVLFAVSGDSTAYHKNFFGQESVFSSSSVANTKLLSSGKMKPQSFTIGKLPEDSQIFDQDKMTIYKADANGKLVRDSGMTSLARGKVSEKPMLAGWLFVVSTVVVVIFGSIQLIRRRRKLSA